MIGFSVSKSVRRAVEDGWTDGSMDRIFEILILLTSKKLKMNFLAANTLFNYFQWIGFFK